MIETECKLEEGDPVAGVKQVTKGLQKGDIATVYIATDCDGFIESKVLSFVKKETVIKKYTGKQLGRACNIDVEAAVVGIIRKPQAGL